MPDPNATTDGSALYLYQNLLTGRRTLKLFPDGARLHHPFFGEKRLSVRETAEFLIQWGSHEGILPRQGHNVVTAASNIVIRPTTDPASTPIVVLGIGRMTLYGVDFYGPEIYALWARLIKMIPEGRTNIEIVGANPGSGVLDTGRAKTLAEIALREYNESLAAPEGLSVDDHIMDDPT